MSSAALALLVAGCAGAPSLNEGLTTGSLRAPAPQQSAATPAPQPQATPATGLGALNPLPALGQIASTLSRIEPQPVEPPQEIRAAQAVPQDRRADGRITEERTIAGKPMAIYELLARNVHSCFMGGRGPLRTTHMFQGDAKPETKGGAAEISIHEKDPTQQFPRGLMALRIGIDPMPGDYVKVDVSTIRLPKDLGDAMRADVIAWANGNTTQCKAQIVRPPPPVTAVAPAAKTKKKSPPRRGQPTPASARPAATPTAAPPPALRPTQPATQLKSTL